jgi:undecaprenyl-diphosphatase
MMTWWEGIIIGVVQGLTEFLPVSSSGHLVVTQAALGLRAPGVFLEVTVHVATLVAVAVVYWRRIAQLLAGAWQRDRGALAHIGLLLLASIPAAVVGLLFKDWFEATFDSVLIVGVNFLVTGTFLWTTRVAPITPRPIPSVRGALAIGLAQAGAILPGISRSGATVAAGMWTGVDPVRAAEFSFLMAMPAIAGAALLQIPDMSMETAAIGTGPLLLAFAAALASGIAAIRLLVRLLARRAFHQFAPYCWTLGLVTVAWALFRA